MKILVVDDHPLIRRALHGVLTQLDRVVTVVDAQDWESALALIAEHPDLDLVLLDLHLPGVVGFDALAHLREQHPALPVVVLSASDDRNTVTESIERGAMGFIPKSSSDEVMLGALHLVFSGGIYLPPTVLGSAVASAPVPLATPPARSASELGLTERQLQVLVLMLQGKSNKLICRELGLAEGTVKIHVSAVLKALNVTTRTQAVIAASRMGLRFESIGAAAGGV